MAEPGEDFQFAAAVAEFGLLASKSRYPEEASIDHVLSVLKDLQLGDEYKAEFEDLEKKWDKYFLRVNTTKNTTFLL